MTDQNQEKYLTPKEVAGKLGCNVNFIRKEILRRRLSPVLRVNSRVLRVPFATLEAYVRERTV